MNNEVYFLRKRIDDKYNVQVQSKCRDKIHSHARALFFRLCRDKYAMSYAAIGRLANRDHATVLHSCKNLFPVLMENELYRNFYAEHVKPEPIEVKLRRKASEIREEIEELKKQLKELE